MADTKSKGAEKSKPKSGGGEEGGGGSNGFVDAIFWILLVLVAFSVLKGIFSNLGFSIALPSATSFFEFVFDKVQIYSVFLSLIFFIGIIYFNFKLGQLAHESHHRIHGHSHGHDHASDHAVHHDDHAHHAPHLPKAFTDKHSPDKRWQMVESRVNSMSEGDWRLAVLEADIILNDMLSKIGLPGQGIAEKLKAADRSSFHTLDEAWGAHKMRNRIAHEGGSFHVSHDDAKSAVDSYKKVFDEFYFI